MQLPLVGQGKLYATDKIDQLSHWTYVYDTGDAGVNADIDQTMMAAVAGRRYVLQSLFFSAYGDTFGFSGTFTIWNTANLQANYLYRWQWSTNNGSSQYPDNRCPYLGHDPLLFGKLGESIGFHASRTTNVVNWRVAVFACGWFQNA